MFLHDGVLEDTNHLLKNRSTTLLVKRQSWHVLYLLASFSLVNRTKEQRSWGQGGLVIGSGCSMKPPLCERRSLWLGTQTMSVHPKKDRRPESRKRKVWDNQKRDKLLRGQGKKAWSTESSR